MHYLAIGATGTRKLEPGSSEVKPGLIRAFLYPDPGPGYTRVRTSSQILIYRTQKPAKIYPAGRTRTHENAKIVGWWLCV